MTPLLAIGPDVLALEPLVAAVTERPGARPAPTAPSRRFWAWFATTTSAGASDISSTRRTSRWRAARSSASPAKSRREWPGIRLALHHRVGRLEIGEASVAIAAASAHRADAFGACRYTIERVKQIAPIWKREFFEGGDVWIEGATADPDDAGAREVAERAACA